MELNILTILLLGSLAVTRLSLLFVEEDGPYGIFQKLRDRFGIVQFKDANDNILGQIVENGYDNILGSILDCKWCFSIWSSVILYLIYIIFPPLFLIITIILSFSMISIIINTILEKVME